MTGSIVIVLMAATAVTAAIVFQQDVGFTNAAQTSDVRFVDGGGGADGFATVSIGSGATSATLSLTGITGAVMTVTDLLQIQNADASQAYTITLGRSTAPHAAIEGLTFTVLDGSTTISTYDAAASASGSSWTLPVSTTYDIQLAMDIADGTAAGSLGSFTLQFSIAPA